MGTRSLQETGAQMTGEVLVVWESSQAGTRGVLGSGGDLRFWGINICVVMYMCGCVPQGRTEGE